MFQPSAYSDPVSSSSSSSPTFWDKASALVQQAAPALSLAQELIGKSTPEKLAILKAKVANYQRLMRTPPYSTVPGISWYRSEIAKMQAQISALETEARQEASASADYGLWRRLTSAGGIVGIGLGLAGIYFVVRRASAP